MAFQLFRALFNISGNAPDSLTKIKVATQSLVTSTNALIPNLRVMQNEIMRVATATNASASPALIAVDNNFNRITQSGNVTSGSLLNLQRQMLATANTSNVVLSRTLQNTSASMNELSASTKVAENTAREASATGGFQMMGDVSGATATRMKQLSAASQGAMIAMAGLQRNVMGLAFSLIFLQFTGFLRLSLMVAGVGLALGGLFFGFKALISQGSKFNILQDQFFILTGGADAYQQALSGAEGSGKDLGLTSELLRAQLTLLREDVALDNQELDAFAEALQLMHVGVVPNALKDIDSMTTAFKDFLDPTTTADTDIFFRQLIEGEGQWQEAVDRLNATDTGQFQTKMRKAKEEFGSLFVPIETDIAEWWQDFQISWINFGSNIMRILGGDMGALWSMTVWQPMTTITIFFVNIIRSIFFDLLINPIINNFGWFGNVMRYKFTDMWLDIQSIGRTLWTLLVLTYERTFINEILSLAGNLALDIFNVGVSIVVGLWDGIRSKKTWLLDHVTGLGGSILGAFRSGLGNLWPFSPSKVGIAIGEGLGLGIVRGIQNIDTSVVNASRLLGQFSTRGIVSQGIGRNSRAQGSIASSSITINIRDNNFGNADPAIAGRTMAGEILKGITRGGSITSAPLVP